ncbi:hypothetical protein LINGRAHAP2_LOCUS31984 [Linum grandiflorum]
MFPSLLLFSNCSHSWFVLRFAYSAFLSVILSGLFSFKPQSFPSICTLFFSRSLLLAISDSSTAAAVPVDLQLKCPGVPNEVREVMLKNLNDFKQSKLAA